MSTIKITELAKAALIANNEFAHAGSDGIANRATLQALSDFCSVNASLAFRGDLAIADTPSEDGFYFATQSGTYTNAGNLVTDLTQGLNIISVTGTQTTFSLTQVPLTQSTVNEVDPTNTIIAVNGRGVSYERSRRIFIQGSSDYTTIFRDSVTRGQVLNIFETLNIYGVEDVTADIRPSFFAKFSDGRIQLKFAQKQSDNTWSEIFNEIINVGAVNQNGTNLYDAKETTSLVRVVAELDLRDIADVNWSFQSNADAEPYFIVKPERVHSYYENPTFETTSIWVRNSTTNIYTNDFYYQAQKIFPVLRLIGADPSYKYSTRYIARNEATNAYRFIITFNGGANGAFIDYADFQLIDDQSSENGHATVIDRVITLKNGVQKIKLYAVIDYTHITDGTTQTLFSNGSFTLNPVYVEKIVSEENNTIVTTDNYPLVTTHLESIRTMLVAKNENVYVKFDGDSMTANSATDLFDNPERRPAQSISKNWVNLLYDYGLNTIVDSYRYDADSFFTETGTGWTDDTDFFTVGTGILNAWERMSNGDNCKANYTNGANASFSFSWNLDENDYCDVKYPMRFDFTSTATVSITQGNNKVEVEQTGTNTEANGHVFSQNLVRRSQGSGYANQMANVILPLRKKSGATGTVTVTISKGNNSEYFGYWGCELYDTPRLIVDNIAKGGDEIERSADKYRNNLFERKTHLLIHTLNCNNDVTYNVANNPGVYPHINILNAYQDYFFGDRAGNLNPNSIKNLSNNFADLKLLVILPNPRNAYLSGNAAKKKNIDGSDGELDVDVRTFWLNCATLFKSKGIPIIDNWEIMKAFAISKGKTLEEVTTSIGATDKDAFTADDVHPSNVAYKTIAGQMYRSIFPD